MFTHFCSVYTLLFNEMNESHLFHTDRTRYVNAATLNRFYMHTLGTLNDICAFDILNHVREHNILTFAF